MIIEFIEQSGIEEKKEIEERKEIIDPIFYPGEDDTSELHSLENNFSCSYEEVPGYFDNE